VETGEARSVLIDCVLLHLRQSYEHTGTEESERNESCFASHDAGIDYGKGPPNAFVIKWFYM
jgi:hypothetical protein